MAAPAVSTAVVTAPEGDTLQSADVQGLVVSGFAALTEARYVFLEILDGAAARAWLGRLAERVNSAAAPPGTVGRARGPEGHPADDVSRNVALTHAGLAALGVSEDDLRTFPAPFREGMASPFRQRVLGDRGPSDPSTWMWGGPRGSGPDHADALHVLLLLFARDAATMATLEAEETALATADGALRVRRTLTPAPLTGSALASEHFGFADGISQPVPAGTAAAERLGGDERRRQVIAPGEFVLGHANGYDKRTPSPRLRDADVGTNGTYLVVRDLAQDVAGFRAFLREGVASAPEPGPTDPDPAELLAAKLVGRWRSGASLVHSPHRDDPDLAADNAFGYTEVDPHGERCPLGSHVRRSNPRDALTSDVVDPAHALRLANLHRLLRRGRTYGPPLPPGEDDDGVPRGLYFLCLGANIERQFEFVQQSWCNNPKFAGLYDEQDPLLGSPPAGTGTFTVQGSPVASRVHGLSSFVTVRGGAYLFMPGLAALRRLGEPAG